MFGPDALELARIQFGFNRRPSHRIMVALGFAMLGLALWALWRRVRDRLDDDPWLLRAAIAMGPAGFLAIIAGWITTEVGRQPYTVHGLLRTDQSVAPLEASAVGISLLAFILIYFTVFGAGVFYILRLMHAAPSSDPHIEDIGPTRTAGITPAPSAASQPHPAA